MPYKPKKPCAYRSCSELTNGRYCEFHAKLEVRDYEKYRRNPDTRKWYGKTWKRIRNKYIKANPLCEICKAEGRLTPAQEVHHKKKLADGGTHDWHNLQSLCSECHSRLHAKNGDYF